MPRLRQVPLDEVRDDAVRRVYAQMFDSRDPVSEPGTATGTPGDWWTVFALVPDVMRHAVRGFQLYRSPERLLDPVLRELAQTRVGWDCQSQFVFSQHCKSCRGLGISEEKIGAIPHWPVSDAFTPAERAVLAFTDALALDGGRVPDGVFADLKRHLSDEEILELVYITTLYIQHSIMSRALRTEWDDVDERMVEVPGDHASLAPGADGSGPPPPR